MSFYMWPAIGTRAHICWSESLQKEKGWTVWDDQIHKDTLTVIRLRELLLPRTTNPTVWVAAISHADARRRHSPRIVLEEILQQLQIERINQAQDEETWISDLKIYLTEDVSTITSADEQSCALIAPGYEVD